MKIFTKSVLVAIAMMAGATTANAQDDGWMDPEQWVEVDASWWHEWKNPDEDRCTGKAEITGDFTPGWNFNTDIREGKLVLGSDGVAWNQFADISDYDKLIIFGSTENNTHGCRVMCNREINEGAWKNYMLDVWANDPHYVADLDAIVFDLSEFKTMTCNANNGVDSEGVKTGDERIDDYVHLHALKNAWAGEVHTTVSGLFVWKASGTSGIKTIKNEVAGDGAYYNLQGQRVDNPTKGLFIHNGKKVILK
jgi:hypothetical protein